MNCSACIELMTDLSRTVPIDASRRDGAFRHIETCESCSRRFTLELDMQRNLALLREEDSGLQAPDHIRHNLAAAFSQQMAQSTTGKAFNRTWRFALGAVAAVLLVLIGYAVLTSTQSARDLRVGYATPTPVPTVVPDKPSQNDVAKIFGDAEQMRLIGDRSKKGKNRTRTEKPEKPSEKPEKSAPVASVSYELGEFKPLTPQPELATDFIPLVATRGLPPSDSGQVIRVSVPRSAMAYFGLPVPLEPPGQQVTADVLVADGLARAVRFVR